MSLETANARFYRALDSELYNALWRITIAPASADYISYWFTHASNYPEYSVVVECLYRYYYNRLI